LNYADAYFQLYAGDFSYLLDLWRFTGSDQGRQETPETEERKRIESEKGKGEQ